MQLEYVQAVVTAEQLASGVDLLRTLGNEVTLIGGCTVEDQVWQSARVSCDDPAAIVSLSAGARVVGAFSVGDRQRLAKMLLIPHGSVVRAVARGPARFGGLMTTRFTLEIFGWAVLQELFPAVEAALALLESS